MKKLLLVAILLLAALLSGAYLSRYETVRLGGAEELISPMQELATLYQAQNRASRVEVLSDNVESLDGIQATQEGRIAVGLTARTLRADEEASLQYHAIGRIPIVAVVPSTLPVESLTQAQLCDVFAGRTTSWRALGGPDEKIMVATRKEGDTIKRAVRARLACFRTLQETRAAFVPATDQGLQQALSRVAVIGFATLDFVRRSEGRVKALALTSVTPSAESVRDGSYPLFQEVGLVTRGVPSGLAHRFLEFVATPEGARVLDRHGIVLASAL